MFVKLKYRTQDGKQYSTTERMTVKEAEVSYKEHEHLSTDNNIIKVWLSYFDGWHYLCHKTLKDLTKTEQKNV